MVSFRPSGLETVRGWGGGVIATHHSGCLLSHTTVLTVIHQILSNCNDIKGCSKLGR